MTATSAPARQRVLPAGWRERTRDLLRRAFTEHRGITILVLIGAALRLAVMIGYQPALWYHGDSGVYIRNAKQLIPPADPFRPAGYSQFLKVLWPTQTLFSVVAVQHLMGLAVAVAVYVFLQRRGLPRWLSCLAAVPLIFDSLQVTLEQFILVETMFTTILVASFLVLLWNRMPSTKVCIAAGVLLFAAWFTKPLALPVLFVVAAYLVLRRVGWRKVVGLAVAFAIPYTIVQILVAPYTSVYGSNSSAIYGRAASIADCERIQLSAEQRVLCPAPDQRGMRPDWYIWADDAPGTKLRGKASAYPNMRSFAISVITQQPGDYVRQVSKEVAAHFVPGVDLGWSYSCLRERFSLPETARDTKPLGLQCHAQLAGANFDDTNVPSAQNPPATPLTKALAAYAKVARMSPVVVSFAFVVTFIAYFVRRRGQWSARRRMLLRGGDGSTARDAGMLVAASAALIILPVLIGMYEARYALPALPLVCVAGALSVHHLRLARTQRRAEPAETPAAP